MMTKRPLVSDHSRGVEDDDEEKETDSSRRDGTDWRRLDLETLSDRIEAINASLLSMLTIPFFIVIKFNNSCLLF